MLPSLAKPYQFTRDIDADHGPITANFFAHFFAKETWTTSDIQDFFTGRQAEAPNCLEPLRDNVFGTICPFEISRGFIRVCQSTHVVFPPNGRPDGARRRAPSRNCSSN